MCENRNIGAGRHGLNGSLTVEAALCFPLFLFAVITLCYLFICIETGLTVQECMLETAREISAYGDLIEAAENYTRESLSHAAETEKGRVLGNTVIDYANGPASVRLLLTEQMSKYPLIGNAVEGGVLGISCEGSVLFSSEECIRINCEYRVKLPFSFVFSVRVGGTRTLEYRYFTGHKVPSALEAIESEQPEEDEETVYKTETGTVYHVKLSCPSLKLSIKEVTANEISNKRNGSGAKYYACEKCAKGGSPEKLYITTEGDRYHYSIGCSGLKRTITEVKRSAIPNFRACKRCRKE